MAFTSDQKIGLGAIVVGGSIAVYLLWPKKASAAPKKISSAPPAAKKATGGGGTTTTTTKQETVKESLQPASFFTDENKVEWKIIHSDKYSDGSSLPSGQAFVRAIVNNDSALDSKYNSVWYSRYAEGKGGAGIVSQGSIKDYQYLKNALLSRVKAIAAQAKAEVDYYKQSEFKGSSGDSDSSDEQQGRISGMKWWDSYSKGTSSDYGYVGALKHPYYYGVNGKTGAVRNPYYYGSHGVYPSPSYAPLTEQRPGGIPTPHGAVGTTNIGPIDIDPFYVEKITLKKRR